MATKRDRSKIRSTTHKFPIEGAYGLCVIGPLAQCGNEDRGGVSMCMLDHNGKQTAGGTMMREHVADLHFRLGQWLEVWKNEG